MSSWRSAATGRCCRPCTLPEQPHADLRHEPGLGRLPDERLPRGRAAAGGSRGPRSTSSIRLRMTAYDETGRRARGAGHQRGLAVPADLPGGEAQDLRRRQGAARGADLRRRAACRRPPAPPPTISRRTGRSCPIDAPLLVLTPISPFRPRRWRGAHPAQRGHGPDRGAGAGQAPGERGRRQHRDSRCARRRGREASDVDLFMMFDPGHSLDERILREQFDY